jgi:hypothetical protein
MKQDQRRWDVKGREVMRKGYERKGLESIWKGVV